MSLRHHVNYQKRILLIGKEINNTMEEIKIIANYLPQYHEIKENNMFWGQGYTDWVAVRNARSVIQGQSQPRTPLNNHYYKLDDPNEIRWQADLARNNGIYGFAIYHYWFSECSHLLKKPAELILHNPDIDINYMFLWDNSSWKRTWVDVGITNACLSDDEKAKRNNKKSDLLIELIYGDEKAWKYHFDYLLPFFKDPRYIKLDGKPMFGFFQPYNNPYMIQKMISYWNDLAIQEGFPGIHAMVRNYRHDYNMKYKFKYTPFSPCTVNHYIKFKIKDVLCEKLKHPKVFDYDKYWNEILAEAEIADPETFLSGFVMYDDTPRRGNGARIVKGSTPEKFQYYLKQLVDISLRQRKEYLFLTAWNEWGEGAYLEPDIEFGYAYLQAVKDVVFGNC